MKRSNENLNALNPTEETVMQAIWDVKKGFVGDIIQRLPEPKPPYNTVVTTIRNLEKNGYVRHETFVNAHRYSAVVDRPSYLAQELGSLVRRHFNSSYDALLSFFVEGNVIGKEQLEEALRLVGRLEQESKGGEQ